jgi:hypothetical protein
MLGFVFQTCAEFMDGFFLVSFGLEIGLEPECIHRIIIAKINGPKEKLAADNAESFLLSRLIRKEN